MESKQIIRDCLAVVLIFPLAQVLSAQSEAAQDGVEVTSQVELNDINFGTPAGAPFVGSWKSTSVRRGRDGTTATTVSPVLKMARDSAGRTLIETLGHSNPAKWPPVVFFQVWDPVKHVGIDWTSIPNQASLFHMPGLRQKSKESPSVPWNWGAPGSQDGNPLWELKHLGTKTIHGVVAEGIYATRVVPGGKEDTGQPVMITEERWYSRDLQITVLNIYNDPRDGSHTWEMTDLERTEPDPVLFQVPAGYDVKEANQKETDQE
jgi:hypothetical protein